MSESPEEVSSHTTTPPPTAGRIWAPGKEGRSRSVPVERFLPRMSPPPCETDQTAVLPLTATEACSAPVATGKPPTETAASEERWTVTRQTIRTVSMTKQALIPTPKIFEDDAAALTTEAFLNDDSTWCHDRPWGPSRHRVDGRSLGSPSGLSVAPPPGRREGGPALSAGGASGEERRSGLAYLTTRKVFVGLLPAACSASPAKETRTE